MSIITTNKKTLYEARLQLEEIYCKYFPGEENFNNVTFCVGVQNWNHNISGKRIHENKILYSIIFNYTDIIQEQNIDIIEARLKTKSGNNKENITVLI